MIIDNPVGLQYLFSDDIYLLKQDMDSLNNLQSKPAEANSEVTEEPVLVNEKLPVVTEAPVIQFNYLGGNAKQFLILCHYTGSEQMDDKHLEALKSALSRKDLALDDVAILNINKYATATVNQLNGYFKPDRLLILGKPGLLSGWDQFALNQLTNLGTMKVLYTYSFAEMMGDRDKTKAFWEQMKVL